LLDALDLLLKLGCWAAFFDRAGIRAETGILLRPTS
jgi:hypothetical protein